MTDAYVRQLAAQLLERTTEVRVPCPNHPQQRLADLIVRRRDDGHGDGWAVLDNDHSHTWTGLRWAPVRSLCNSDIYRYPDIHTAHAEADRIAPLETETFLNRIRNLYRQHEKESSRG